MATAAAGVMPDDQLGIAGNVQFSGSVAPRVAGLLVGATALLAVLRFAGFRFNVGVSS